MPYVVKRGKKWQARWKLPSGKWKAETRQAWTKGAAREYAMRMEENVRRTPWASASPAELPYLIDYGLIVLMSRTVSLKTQKDQSAAWRNRVAPHFDSLKLNEVAPVDNRMKDVGHLRPISPGAAFVLELLEQLLDGRVVGGRLRRIQRRRQLSDRLWAVAPERFEYGELCVRQSNSVLHAGASRSDIRRLI